MFQSSSVADSQLHKLPNAVVYAGHGVAYRVACSVDACYGRGAPRFFRGSSIWDLETSPDS